MARVKHGMRPYKKDPETGYGCHSCTHLPGGCTTECTLDLIGGTGYEFNDILNHKVFWLSKRKIVQAEE